MIPNDVFANRWEVSLLTVKRRVPITDAEREYNSAVLAALRNDTIFMAETKLKLDNLRRQLHLKN